MNANEQEIMADAMRKLQSELHRARIAKAKILKAAEEEDIRSCDGCEDGCDGCRAMEAADAAYEEIMSPANRAYTEAVGKVTPFKKETT